MIVNFVTFEGEIVKLVDSYNSLPSDQKQANYWESKDINEVRDKIKSFYIEEQDFKCCYCEQSLLSRHGRAWDIDHIVPKALRPDFMFEPKNLAISCIDCNIEKGDENVLHNKSLKKYPNKAKPFKIIHPHFDEYNDHIRIFLNLVYSPKTDKGRFTIETCGLLRYAYEHLDWSKQFTSNEKLLEKFGEVMDSKTEQEKNSKVLEVLLIAQITVSKTLL